MVKFVEVEDQYLQILAKHAPHEQVIEVLSSHNTDIYTVAKEGALRSERAWVALHDEDVIGVFGIIPITLTGIVASPWLLTTGKYPKDLLRGTKIVLPLLLDRWPILINYIDARYKASLRWAEWAGFQIHPAHPYGKQNQPFHMIEMRK